MQNVSYALKVFINEWFDLNFWCSKIPKYMREMSPETFNEYFGRFTGDFLPDTKNLLPFYYYDNAAEDPEDGELVNKGIVHLCLPGTGLDIGRYVIYVNCIDYECKHQSCNMGDRLMTAFCRQPILYQRPGINDPINAEEVWERTWLLSPSGSKERLALERTVIIPDPDWTPKPWWGLKGVKELLEQNAYRRLQRDVWWESFRSLKLEELKGQWAGYIRGEDGLMRIDVPFWWSISREDGGLGIDPDILPQELGPAALVRF